MSTKSTVDRIFKKPLTIIAFMLTAVYLGCAKTPLNLSREIKMDSIKVDPAEIKTVKGETLKLTEGPLNKWSGGTNLRNLQTLKPGHGTPTHGALIPKSLVIKFGEKTLLRDTDYILEPEWGTVMIAPNSTVTVNDQLTADYSYSLLRIDSLVRNSDGTEQIIKGKSDLTTPMPPQLTNGQKLLANIFVNYQSNGTDAQVLPFIEPADAAKTASTPHRIPKTLAKIKSGQPTKIVCWGDSVTCGGDASSVETRYTSVFERKLKEKFPQSDITFEVIAVGGSVSKQWTDVEKGPGRLTNCRFERIIEAKPDLVTIEFVNDSYGDGYLTESEDFIAQYSQIIDRIRKAGAEIIFITPHFSMFMPHDRAERKYDIYLKELAEKENIAVADAAARWFHLHKEGLPYTTLLKNAINHPDDRGHMIFAEEIIKCFE